MGWGRVGGGGARGSVEDACLIFLVTMSIHIFAILKNPHNCETTTYCVTCI